MIKRVKDVVINIGSGTTPKSGEPRYYDNGNIPWLNSGDLNDSIVTTTAKTITQEAVKEFSALHFYPKGSVVVAMYGASIGNTGIIDFETTVNQACCVLIPDNEQISPYFLQLLLKLAKPKFLLESFGGTQPNISQKIVANMLIDVPPLAEQEAIAAYLDKECEKIGREIELLERKADGYRRLRRSIINRAVTRGLNPNTPLKPSGLRWIPLIPEHWSISRVRNFFNYRNEKVSEIDFAPLSVTRNGVVPQMENVAKSMAEGDTRKKVCKNDFVVNSRSDRKGSCGTAPLDGSVSLIYIVLEPTNIDPHFANYYFRCNDWIEEFYRNGKGIVADLWTTNYSAMRNIEIAVPPFSEQIAIANFLDEKCGKIDAIVEKIEAKIERLKVLKRSLINEVVTGQRAINQS